MTLKNITKLIRDNMMRKDSSAIGLEERGRELEQFLYALLTKEHLLLNGGAGTAKSLFAEKSFHLIGATPFKVHITKFMSEDAVFGPIDFKKLKTQSVIEYNTKGTALDAQYLFLDEFFDASDVLLRSFLGLLNERKWSRGTQSVDSPLHTAIVTSNYLRENEVTDAVLDRFIFKANIKPLRTKSSRVNMYMKAYSEPMVLISQKEIDTLTKAVGNVTLTKKIAEFSDEIRTQFCALTKKTISDRTANKAMNVLRASAAIHDRDETTKDDLEALRYVFCTLNETAEEDKFDIVLAKIVGLEDAEKEISEIFELVQSRLDSLPYDITSMNKEEFMKKMHELNESLTMLTDIDPPTGDIRSKKDELVSRIAKFLKDSRETFVSKMSESSPVKYDNAVDTTNWNNSPF